MVKKILGVLLAMVMLASCVACTANTGAPATEAPAAAPAAEAPAAASEAPAETAPAEKVTVTIWHYFPDSYVGVFNDQIAAFNKSQDRIEVVPTFVARDELLKQYSLGAISGELPDIGLIDSPDMSTYIQMGVFENISEDLANWADLGQFLAGPLNSCKDANGDIYGLPHNTNNLGFVYNKNILKEIGFEGVPTTWSDIETISAACAAKGYYGLAISAQSTENCTFQFFPFLYSAGGSYKEVNSAAGVKALTFMTDLFKKGYMSTDILNWTQGEAFQSFISGNTAMVVSGPWNVPTLLNTDVGFEWGISEIPCDDETNVHASVIGGENLGVCVGTEHKAEAIEVLQYILSAQSNADYAEVAGRFPVRSDAYALKDCWTDESSPYYIYAQIMQYSVQRGPEPNWSSISEALYTNVQAAYLDQKTPQAALDDAAAAIAPLLQK